MLSDFEIRYGAPTKEESECSLNDDTPEEEVSYFQEGAPKKRQDRASKKQKLKMDN